MQASQELNCFVLMFISFIEVDPALIRRFTDAARCGTSSEVVDMLSAGIPADSRDLLGWTALMWAADNNHTDIVHLLLQKGGNVNEQTDAGTTALHFAARGNLTDVMRVLLKQGASTNIKNKYGRTPLDLARLKNKEEAVCLLEQHEVLAP